MLLVNNEACATIKRVLLILCNVCRFDEYCWIYTRYDCFFVICVYRTIHIVYLKTLWEVLLASVKRLTNFSANSS